MVAKITTPHRIMDALNYNEEKVTKGNAECLAAVNYLRDTKDLYFDQKLSAFERLNELNERATTKTLHVSLNFNPSENLSNEILTEIATVYMAKIGFSNQPFLVYKHLDAGHPHIHIVSNTIKADGSRINTHNIGRNQSEKARKEIEINYGLVKAENQDRKLEPIRPLDVQKVFYGKAETKKGITNVVNAVFNTYRYASLPEYNAVLRQYNVVADRGNEDGRIYKHRGLIYRVLDADGNKTGVPIKASSINSKPILDTLEKKFLINVKAKEPFKISLRETIDSALSHNCSTMKMLTEVLLSQQIYTLLRKANDGRIYGITFVDNKNRCVFNGSDLGKAYSATSIQKGLLENSLVPQKYEPVANEIKAIMPPKNAGSIVIKPHGKELQKEDLKLTKTDSIMDILISANGAFGNTPHQLLKKKRKKKKNM